MTEAINYFKKCLRHKSFSTYMFTQGRWIENKSVCLTEPNQNYPKNISA